MERKGRQRDVHLHRHGHRHRQAWSQIRKERKALHHVRNLRFAFDSRDISDRSLNALTFDELTLPCISLAGSDVPNRWV